MPWRNMKPLEVANTLAAVGSLVVAIVALIIASDTSDIKSAVSNLGSLAQQTARQAKALEDQFGQIKQQTTDIGSEARALQRQADAQTGQLAEAQKQTKAIAEQTQAIKQTSTAEIQSAQAQKRMADVTAQAQLPGIDLQELRVNGLKADTEKSDGRVPFTLYWSFHNTGGSALKVKDVRFGLQFTAALPQQMPSDLLVSNGNDIVLTNGITSAFHPIDPIPMRSNPEARDAVISGKSKIFFMAVFQYEDSTGNPHQKCFGRQIILKEGTGDGDYSIQAGGPAYHCQT